MLIFFLICSSMFFMSADMIPKLAIHLLISSYQCVFISYSPITLKAANAAIHERTSDHYGHRHDGFQLLSLLPLLQNQHS